MTQCHALIPCGGTGQRLGGEIPKQYIGLLGKPMVNYCLDVFIESKEVSSIWVGVSSNLSEASQKAISWPESKDIHIEETAGPSRHHTVLNTLKQMLDSGVPSSDWVLVHDAARPGISAKLVTKLVQTVLTAPNGAVGGILALPVADSLKQQNNDFNGVAQSSGGRSRDGLWQAQTPQMFRLGDLRDALESAIANEDIVTDEASAFERIGKYPLLVQGSNENLKVTYPEDWALIKKIIGFNDKPNLNKVNFMDVKSNKPMIRIGQGYDVHQLVEGRPLILGGIEIPHEKGLLGHSDADALLHAITDALLGSVGLGDVGKHFPDTDPANKAADSRDLLTKAYSQVKSVGYQVGNIDASVICQKPKLADYLPQMSKLIAEDLGLENSQVNIKAKTNEGLGYLGAGEAIATEAVVMVYLSS
jgi:2-C-methyl-D-erythritol 4-phosphate cytidylyltransferase/2-C-methyl-D-erythritol 2,4-cyclodiphosphate synthase